MPNAAARPRLSVAIITRNEAHNIAACVRSVAWADEIVVLDNDSTDQTRELAQQAGARVVLVPDWPGFGIQKNRAVAACTGDWVLSIDADERVTPALRAEIDNALRNPHALAYEMPRQSTYCGKLIKHAGWQPDWCLRLFKRGEAQFSEHRVHERVLTKHPVGRLSQPLLHFSFRSMDDVLTKINRYSSESAAMIVAQNKQPGLLTAVIHGVAAFVRTYFVKRGFLDGRHGFLLAVSNAEGSYYRYVKAMLAAQTKRDDHEPMT